MFYNFILYCAALCNMSGTTEVCIDAHMRYTIIVNDIILEKDKELPEYLFQDMTQNYNSDECTEEEDSILFDDPDNCITISITTKKTTIE